jgi:hypothetical protein
MLRIWCLYAGHLKLETGNVLQGCVIEWIIGERILTLGRFRLHPWTLNAEWYDSWTLPDEEG